MTNVQDTFSTRRDACARDVEALLGQLIDQAPSLGEIARPPRLIAAMRHAALGGGKRLRPFLVLKSSALFGVAREHARLTAAALECIHCYSLVHDDLPAMDNDDLRRGRPTVHKAFDEATAILAGDALLTFAFDILARPQTHPDPQTRLALTSALARAAGMGGMVGGQMLDLEAEGRYAPDRQPLRLGQAAILRLQGMKTGALLAFACVSGAILAGEDGPQRTALETYGAALGQAFQIADDLLDAEGDSAAMGKAARKDAGAGKATLVGILGPQAARARCAALVRTAQDALAPFGARGDVLRAAVQFVAERSA